jgi:hypothetical protein
MKKSKAPRHYKMRAEAGDYRVTGHDIKVELAQTVSRYFAPVVAIYTEVGKAFQSATAQRRTVNGHPHGKSK